MTEATVGSDDWLDWDTATYPLMPMDCDAVTFKEYVDLRYNQDAFGAPLPQPAHNIAPTSGGRRLARIQTLSPFALCRMGSEFADKEPNRGRQPGLGRLGVASWVPRLTLIIPL